MYTLWLVMVKQAGTSPLLHSPTSAPPTLIIIFNRSSSPKERAAIKVSL